MANPLDVCSDSHSRPTSTAMVGPVIPNAKLPVGDVTRKTETETQMSSALNTTTYGPALPPPLPVRTIVGPALPSWLNTRSDDDVQSDDDDEEPIGPMPLPSSEVVSGNVRLDIERRAEKMKNKLTNKGESDELKREEWMTELPPELSKNFGLGARTFQRRTPGPTGDRSIWTDTPSQRMEKEKAGSSRAPDLAETDAEMLVRSAQQKYDKDMEKISQEHNNAKRQESLLDLHKKGLKRKGKKEKESKDKRRPFDRDVDLKVNAMDDARRRALIKQSRQLNDKFSSGRSQFL